MTTVVEKVTTTWYTLGDIRAALKIPYGLFLHVYIPLRLDASADSFVESDHYEVIKTEVREAYTGDDVPPPPYTPPVTPDDQH